MRRTAWCPFSLQLKAEHVEEHIRPHLRRTRVGPRCGRGADLEESGGSLLPWAVMRDLQADLELGNPFVVGMTLKRTPKRGETRRWRWCIAGLTSVGWRFIGIKVGHANRMNRQARSTACGGVFGEKKHVFDRLPCGVRPTTVEVILVEVKSGTAPNTNSAFEVGRRRFNMLTFGEHLTLQQRVEHAGGRLVIIASHDEHHRLHGCRTRFT